MAARKNWSREEHLIAFNLYCQIPFGRIYKTNPRIIALAEVLGRTPSAVVFKLGNFGRLDPALQARGVKGLSHGAKGEEEIWGEFAGSPERLAYESEKLIAAKEGRPLVEAGVGSQDATGLDREAMVKLRVNQNFFRKRVLSAYSNKCCITGLSCAPLLIASHIIPWAEDVENRLNPRNGLCLNALHDKAFDRNLMWVERDYTIRMSPRLFESEVGESVGADWLAKFDGVKLCLPKHFSPDADLLSKHAEKSKANN